MWEVLIWEVLCEGALALSLLVAGDKPADFPHARHVLEFITSRISVPFVIGVTRQDLGYVWVDDVAAYFDLKLSLKVSGVAEIGVHTNFQVF